MYRDDSFLGQPEQGPMYPYENYFVPGPNPAPGLITNAAAGIDPNRLHAPIADNKPWFEKDDSSSNPAIQRIPGTPDEYKSVGSIPVYVPDGGYHTPFVQFNRGWVSGYIPELGNRTRLHAQTPLLQLKQPIRSYSGKADGISQPKRKPVKFRAPKAKD